MGVIHRISESVSKEKELMELLDAHGVPYDADYVGELYGINGNRLN